MILYNKKDLNVPCYGKNDKSFCISRERQIELAILKYVEQTTGKKLYMEVDDDEDIDAKSFLIRTTIEFYNQTHYKNSPKALNHRNNRNIIENWPSLLTEEQSKMFLKRKLITTTLGTFVENKWFRELFANHHKQVFCKTVLKEHGFADCCPMVDDVPENILSALVHKGPLVNVIVSEPLNMGQEYRTFVVNGKAICSSTYDDYEVYPVLENIRHFINDMVASLKHEDMPKNYVIDIGESNRGLVLIEMNDIGLSGRYIGNDFCKILKEMYGLSIDKPYTDFVEEFDKNIVLVEKPKVDLDTFMFRGFEYGFT